MRPARIARVGSLLITLVIGLTAGRLEAAEPSRKPKHGTPPRPARVSTEITGTIAKPSVAPPVVPVARDAEIPQPITLPPASRTRVRACGAAWRDMKLAGTTGDDDWRDFAFKCYVGKGPVALAD